MAGVVPWRSEGGYDPIIKKHKPYILESFYYVDEVTEKLLPFFGDFMLDSGAFSFMENPHWTADWDEYVERYASFIKKNKVKNFLELDIDNVVGYEKVKTLRNRLECLVGQQCIPVWHIGRGKDEFLRMCDEYPYVALGGIVSGEWSPKAQQMFPWFIKEAHKRGAKIHGLGYTNMNGIKKYHFDSVDSTAWTSGNRFGHIYQFKNGQMLKHSTPKGKRIGKAREVALINYTEWIKFQKYAETNL